MVVDSDVAEDSLEDAFLRLKEAIDNQGVP